MKKVVIDENIPYIKGVLESFFDVVYRKGIAISKDDVADASSLIVRTRTKCDVDLLDGSGVEFIGTTTIGYDHIDTDYCASHSIEYATSSGCNARAVMQYVASALVAISKEQGWSPVDKILGVIGVGNVGSLVAEFGRQMGFRVICCDPPKGMGVSQDELLSMADIITIHVPLNREGEYKTLSMVDDDFVSKIKQGSIFINSSRGSVVVDSALIGAIRAGRLSAAVIDVWNGEPDINSELLSLVRFATPHIAGYSLQGKANGTSMIIHALSKHFGLAMGDWYPDSAPHQVIDRKMTWSQVCSTINQYYDIRVDDHLLRSNPQEFENLRNGYNYRTEYF